MIPLFFLPVVLKLMHELQNWRSTPRFYVPSQRSVLYKPQLSDHMHVSRVLWYLSKTVHLEIVDPTSSPVLLPNSIPT